MSGSSKGERRSKAGAHFWRTVFLRLGRRLGAALVEAGLGTHLRSQFATRTAGPLTMTLCLFFMDERECLTLAVPERFFLR